MLQRPSGAVRLISRLPKRSLLLRLWNRVLRSKAGKIRRETVFGATMRCDPKDIIEATIVHFGVWEPEITALVQKLIRRGDIAIDVGSHVGYYALLFSKLGAKPIAIEAHPRLAAEVIENDRHNAFKIDVRNVAVAAERGTVTLYEAPATNSGMNTLSSGMFASGVRVEAAPLLDILSDVDLQRVSLIKIDIEGAEAPAMRDILANLPRFSDRFAIIVEAAADWRQTFDGFLAAGFNAWRIPNDLSTAWERLLADEEPEAPRRISSFPSEQCDILFKRSELPRARADPRSLPGAFPFYRRGGAA